MVGVHRGEVVVNGTIVVVEVGEVERYGVGLTAALGQEEVSEVGVAEDDASGEGLERVGGGAGPGRIDDPFSEGGDALGEGVETEVQTGITAVLKLALERVYPGGERDVRETLTVRDEECVTRIGIGAEGGEAGLGVVELVVTHGVDGFEGQESREILVV